MRILWKLSWPILVFAYLQSACSDAPSVSYSSVTSGKDETEFPYVVKFLIDGKGVCTGSFVSDSLLLTAAHCVDTAKVISWNGIEVARSQFFIHPEWPIDGEEFRKARNPKYDTALVRFPDKSYSEEDYAVLLKKSPNKGDELMIVGFGNNLVSPYDKYCSLSKMTNKEGLCTVSKGVRESGAKYNSESIFSFKGATDPAKGEYCKTEDLKKALLEDNKNYVLFVDEQCDGNFRDRSYKETGVGKKRSGTNNITEVNGGLILFSGTTGGADDGINSASGAGDSGGPLFVKENGKYKLAGTTHGESLGAKDDQFIKKSTYVDISSPYIVEWHKDLVAKENLNFPDFLKINN